MTKFIRVNMNKCEVTISDVPQEYRGLGGRALTSTIVAREVPPKCDSLGPENKLVVAGGLLSGTNAPNSGRLSVGAKSPLTGGIKESNAGGTAGHALGRMSIAAIVIEGQPPEGQWYTLVITPADGRLEQASDLAGHGNYDTVAALTKSFGDSVACMTIGQAGEMKLKAAGIAVTDREHRPTRHAGRGGLGAVMGSKGLKAIVIDHQNVNEVVYADRDAFVDAGKRFAKHLMNHPVSGTGLPTYGTNVLAKVVDGVGGYPTRNFATGKFEGVESISGEKQRETILERGGRAKHGCSPTCVIQCSRIYNDKDGNYLTKGPEYETIWAHGAHCCIDDLDAIARMDRIEDDLGLDTIETGVTLGVAMAGGLIEFGDADAAIGLLDEVGKGTPVGRVIGNGAAATGEAYNVKNVPVVKRQAIPAYDPRPIKGIGVTYATSTMGADHTAGYSIATNVLEVGGYIDPLKPEGQVDLSRGLQIATAAIDATGLCLFVAFAVLDIPDALDAIVDMINARLDARLTADDVTELGKKVLRTEREFNRHAGFTQADDRLPSFFRTETLAPHDAVFDIPDDALDQVFNF